MSRGPRLLPTPVGLELLSPTAPDWDAVFGMTGPLELEIGSGYGHFAIGYCERHPHVRYVAFEWRKKWARHVQAVADKRGLRNLRVIEGDAKLHVPRLFRERSLSGIHLQFPDPWWKRAHQKRAVLSPDFAQLLRTLSVPGAKLDLRTDVKELGELMLRTAEEAGWINPLGAGAFHPADPEEVPSSRERRYLAAGEPVYRGRLENRPGA
jgi:tRNA (guanine-N7-)-methyltransferase